MKLFLGEKHIRRYGQNSKEGVDLWPPSHFPYISSRNMVNSMWEGGDLPLLLNSNHIPSLPELKVMEKTGTELEANK